MADEKQQQPRLIKAADHVARRVTQERKIAAIVGKAVKRVRVPRDPRAAFDSLFEKPVGA